MLQHSEELGFSDDEFKAVSKLIHKEIGIALAEHKKSMVYRRLAKRIHELELSSFAEYIKLVENNPSEVSNLANAITTNLTSFFRENHHFEHLESFIIEHMNRNKSLRIWSAGCSSGCEPYSIAMVAANILNKSSYDLKILATDIDTNMLRTGFNGEYDSELFEKIPPKYNKYISYRGDTGIVSPDVKRLISFKRLNLLHNWPMKKKFDIVFCRNVVIYFDKATQRTIFNRFADSIATQGLLYIGHSENLMSVCDRFESLGKTIYRKVR